MGNKVRKISPIEDQRLVDPLKEFMMPHFGRIDVERISLTCKFFHRLCDRKVIQRLHKVEDRGGSLVRKTSEL